MKYLDNLLQYWRILKVKRYLGQNDLVLDIGCGVDAVMFRKVKIKKGIGIDPGLSEKITGENYVLLPGQFPQDLLSEYKKDLFTRITLLAVLEHIPENQLNSFSKACYDSLREGGLLIITVPSPVVDHLLKILKFFHMIDGMSLEQHHGFQVHDTKPIFESQGFKLLVYKRFELGLNHLFVFEKK